MSELLHDLIEQSARGTPGAPALQFAKTVVSYAELGELLRGPGIAEEFHRLVDDYVETHYKRRD